MVQWPTEPRRSAQREVLPNIIAPVTTFTNPSMPGNSLLQLPSVSKPRLERHQRSSQDALLVDPVPFPWPDLRSVCSRKRDIPQSRWRKPWSLQLLLSMISARSIRSFPFRPIASQVWPEALSKWWLATFARGNALDSFRHSVISNISSNVSKTLVSLSSKDFMTTDFYCRDKPSLFPFIGQISNLLFGTACIWSRVHSAQYRFPPL